MSALNKYGWLASVAFGCLEAAHFGFNSRLRTAKPDHLQHYTARLPDIICRYTKVLRDGAHGAMRFTIMILIIYERGPTSQQFMYA